MAATAVGASILLAAGWAGGAALIAFFVSSSLVSRLERRTPTPLDPKGTRRDAWQVLANGGAAAAGAVLAQVGGSGAAVWIATSALAAAAADTWATSLGARSGRPPRHILTGQPVPHGTGGGVTRTGNGGAVAGALVTTGAGAVVSHDPALLPAGIIIGVIGMVADSALGGSVQARFRCPSCERASEWPRHHCGTPTILEGGVRWLTNDLVNALATALAASLGALAWHLLH